MKKVPHNVAKKNLTTFVLLLLVATTSWAQTTNNPQQELLRQSGKIYVVILCICLIFLGIVAFLVHVEKRISKLEKQIENK